MTRFDFKGNCVINGKSYSGNSISVKNGSVTIDGVKQSQELDHNVTIEIHGNVSMIQTECGNVTVNGDVETAKTMSGDLDISGNAIGDSSTMSGDININGSVGGSVYTMSGDIKHK